MNQRCFLLKDDQFPPLSELKRAAYAVSVCVSVCVCSVRWVNCMTPHTSSAIVDVRSDAGLLQPALMSPNALPDANTYTHWDCPTHTFNDFFSSSNPSSKSQHLLFPVFTSLYFIFSLPAGFFSPLLKQIVFRLMRMRSLWISITQCNCPLRKARRDCLPPSISVSFDLPLRECACCGWLNLRASSQEWW